MSDDALSLLLEVRIAFRMTSTVVGDISEVVNISLQSKAVNVSSSKCSMNPISGASKDTSTIDTSSVLVCMKIFWQ